ncbi:uncharacterized protein [Aquarana catesbeiana]|uniref:uncharacterized protein isoform X2 n=2 Tax=Aquarana catesbeiana TaxID=8400 RepID=UPI003CC95D97
MEKWPPRMSEGGSSNKNTSDRQEGRNFPQYHKSGNSSGIKAEVKEEVEETYMWGDEQCIEEEIAPEISTDRGNTRDIGIDMAGEMHMMIKEEEVPVEISTVEFGNRRAREDSWIVQDHQNDSLKAEVKEEAQDSDMRDAGQCKEEEFPTEIGADGQYRRFPGGADPLLGRSTDFLYDEETIEDMYSYTMDSDRGSFENSSDEDEESEPSSPEREPDEELKELLQRMYERVNPPGQPTPPCFQDDPIRLRPPSPSDESPSGDTLIGNSDWCVCGNCRPMLTNYESVCCHNVDSADRFITGEMHCLTEAEEFRERCLNERILRYLLECDNITTKKDFDNDRNRCLRKAAFRSYTRMIHGFWGKKKRIPVPSCVVWAVRNAFPDPDGRYIEVGLWPSDYIASDMALYMY